MLNPFALRQSGESIEAFKLLSTKGKQINKRQAEGSSERGREGEEDGKQMCLQMSQGLEQEAAVSAVGVDIASQMTHGNQKET